jgi:glycosyltransferase involved in cell wall biosynthesis
MTVSARPAHTSGPEPALTKLPSLSIVTMTYNEAAVIRTTLQQLIDVGEQVTDDLELVIVMSEGSQDGTNEILTEWSTRDPRVRTVLQPRSIIGYGQAFKLGLLAASKEYIFQTDADGQFDYGDLVRAVRCLPGYDYVHFNRKDRADIWERRFIGKSYYYMIRAAVSSPPLDFDAAFKLFRRDLLERFSLNCRSGVLVPEFVIKAHLAGARIFVGDTIHQPRLGGEAAWEVKIKGVPIVFPNLMIVFQNIRDLLVLRREIAAFRRSLPPTVRRYPLAGKSSY